MDNLQGPRNRERLCRGSSKKESRDMKQNNRLCFGGIRKALLYTGLILVLTGIGVPYGFCQGVKWVKPEMVFPEHYPYGFHGMGYILSISNNEAVIDDKVFALSPDVAYHTLEIENASSAFFRPGIRVGYLLKSEKEIKSLWLIE